MHRVWNFEFHLLFLLDFLLFAIAWLQATGGGFQLNPCDIAYDVIDRE